MKKKILTVALVFTMIGSLAAPYHQFVSADEYEDGYDDLDEYDFSEDTGEEDYIDPDPNNEIDPYDPVPEEIEIMSSDIKISPSNKRISIGSKFTIEILQADPDFWEEYDEDVWEESQENYIDSIEFKSKKSYIAKVNSSGVVKGKHKGTTTILTTVYFTNGDKKVGKTKVRVK